MPITLILGYEELNYPISSRPLGYNVYGIIYNCKPYTGIPVIYSLLLQVLTTQSDWGIEIVGWGELYIGGLVIYANTEG